MKRNSNNSEVSENKNLSWQKIVLKVYQLSARKTFDIKFDFLELQKLGTKVKYFTLLQDFLKGQKCQSKV